MPLAAPSPSSTTIAKAIAANNRDATRWRASSRLVRRLLRRKIPPRYQTLDVEGSQHPLRPFACEDINDGGLCADADGAAARDHGWIGLMASSGHQTLVHTYVNVLFYLSVS